MKAALQYTNENQAREILSNLVGKRVEIWCTGLRVEGIVEAFKEEEYVFQLKVSHRPVQWGDHQYTISHPSVRKFDGMWMDGISVIE